MRPLALFLATALIVLAQVVAIEYADPDLWGRIAVGAVWFQTSDLPRVEDFSYSAAGATWIDHEWLAGVLFYAVLDAFGEPGLVLLKYGLLVAALAAVFALVRLQRASPYWAVYGLLLTTPIHLLGFVTTVRAQAFSFPLFLWTLWALEAVRLRRCAPAWLALLLPVAVFWGNLHGGFVMGTLAIGCYAAAAALEARWRAAGWLVALALATLVAVCAINPYGLEYGRFLVHAWTLDRSLVGEWKSLLSFPLRPFEALSLVFALGAALLAGAGAWRAWSRERGRPASSALAPSLVLLLLVVMTLRAMRIQTFLALSAVALVPVYLDRAGLHLLPRFEAFLRARSRLQRAALPVLAAALASGYLVLVARVRPILSAVVPEQVAKDERGAIAYPCGAVRWLRHSPYRGRLLNPFTQGEFLLWTLYPKFRVAMDGRYEEVYTQDQLRDVQRFFVDAPLAWRGQLAFAQRSGADFVLFASQWPNLARLAASPGWRKVYDDGQFALVARESALASAPAYAGPPGRRRPRLTIGSYFTPSDRTRFRVYPSSRS